MAYSTRQEVIQALANALSQGSPSTPGILVDVLSVGKLVSDTVNDTQIAQYQVWADENIDAWFSSIYQTPFQRVNRGSLDLGDDVDPADTSIILLDTTRLTVGDVVLLRDSSDGHSQQLTIASIPTDNKINIIGAVVLEYPALTSKIERIRYPDPIPKMSARYAAALLYDKHFAAQVEGNKSEYSTYLRKLVQDDADNILRGTIKLAIPDAGLYMGRRYYNAALDDVPSTRAKPEANFFKAD